MPTPRAVKLFGDGHAGPELLNGGTMIVRLVLCGPRTEGVKIMVQWPAPCASAFGTEKAELLLPRANSTNGEGTGTDTILLWPSGTSPTSMSGCTPIQVPITP